MDADADSDINGVLDDYDVEVDVDAEKDLDVNANFSAHVTLEVAVTILGHRRFRGGISPFFPTPLGIQL